MKLLGTTFLLHYLSVVSSTLGATSESVADQFVSDVMGSRHGGTYEDWLIA